MRTKLQICWMLVLLGAAAAAHPARADVVVIVSAQCPLKNLTTEQLTAIYLGKVNSLPDGTRLVPVDLSEDASSRTAFYSKIIGKSANQVRSYWSRLIFSGKAQPPRAVSSEEALKKLIAEHPDWIGYIDSSALDSSVRPLKLAD